MMFHGLLRSFFWLAVFQCFVNNCNIFFKQCMYEEHMHCYNSQSCDEVLNLKSIAEPINSSFWYVKDKFPYSVVLFF